MKFFFGGIKMKIDHAKRHNRPFVGFPWSSKCTFCPWSGSHSLTTLGLNQPQSLPKPQASYQSTMPLQVLSDGTSMALGILSVLS